METVSNAIEFLQLIRLEKEVEVQFVKQDGTIRRMHCTLDFNKIPKEKRRRVPLLLSNHDIIWVVGYRIDERYKVTKETNHVMKVIAHFN